MMGGTIDIKPEFLLQRWDLALKTAKEGEIVMKKSDEGPWVLFSEVQSMLRRMRERL